MVRSFLAAPLIINDENASGEAAYILAGGNAFWERLSAGADLYHMGRVPKLIFIRDTSKSAYNFIEQRNWSPTEWATDFLVWRGIPPEKILVLDMNERALFGTLSEARFIAKSFPYEIKQLVIVTSPGHTRRSLHAFKRSVSSLMKVVPYSGNSFRTSMEMWEPLWLEYLKLLVYMIIA